jgi:sugar lactone lactonase YvrE
MLVFGPFTSSELAHETVISAANTMVCDDRRGRLVYCGERRGGIWRFDANKTRQAFSPAARFATGIRNAEGFAIDAEDHVFRTLRDQDCPHRGVSGALGTERHGLVRQGPVSEPLS